MPARRGQDIQAMVELALRVLPEYGERGLAIRDRILRHYARSLDYRQEAIQKVTSGLPGPNSWGVFVKALQEEASAMKLVREVLEAYESRQRRLRQ